MNKEVVTKIISQYPPRREYLLKMLHAVQDANPNNYIPHEAMEVIAKHTKLSMAAVMGVVEYYSMFSSKPRGKFLIRICFSPVCITKEVEEILQALVSHFDIKNDNMMSFDKLISIEKSECLGRCGKGNTVSINNHYFDNVSPLNICKQVDDFIKSEQL
jgi:NADH-quinone oxidoreductase subunit E